MVSVTTSRLLGLNLSTGASLFAFPLGGADHFLSPAAGPSAVYVAGGDQVYAFALG